MIPMVALVWMTPQLEKRIINPRTPEQTRVASIATILDRSSEVQHRITTATPSQ